jgi:hypothetical protein
MRTRHKIPTIFNLSMVDVLCCALGCVILLWLVNFREAKRKAAVAGETSSILTETRSQLNAALAETADYRQRLAGVEERLASTIKARDAAQAMSTALAKERVQLTDDLTLARSRATDLGKEIATLKLDIKTTESKLAQKTQDALALAKDKDAAAKQMAAQQAMLKDKEALALAASRAADSLADRLRDNEANTKKLQLLVDTIPKLRDEAAGYREKLTTSESRLTALQKDLGDQKSLTQQAVQARLAAENRFAGITLTGRRVVFLVDMSGSMEYVDEKTHAPEKWVAVRDTLVQIARSLPALEKFQVVLFSDKASYLLGNDDRWINYDPRTSPERIREAIAAVKPKGNTNMYAAFEAAFRFKSDGLDAVYLFSDGLPNIGPGLTPEQNRTLKELERGDILSQYVRRTLKTTWNHPTVDRTRVKINAVGFFYESPDLGAFLWALARENDGSFVGMSKP